MFRTYTAGHAAARLRARQRVRLRHTRRFRPSRTIPLADADSTGTARDVHPAGRATATLESRLRTFCKLAQFVQMTQEHEMRRDSPARANVDCLTAHGTGRHGRRFLLPFFAPCVARGVPGSDPASRQCARSGGVTSAGCDVTTVTLLRSALLGPYQARSSSVGGDNTTTTPSGTATSTAGAHASRLTTWSRARAARRARSHAVTPPARPSRRVTPAPSSAGCGWRRTGQGDARALQAGR